MEIGEVYVKIAGRDANLKCVMLSKPEGNLVMIDGQTRRKKCNMAHLWPTGEKVNIKENASHEEVVEALKKIGLEIKKKVQKQRTAGKDMKTT